jgi:UDP-N-acetylmuramate-alanine ligase
MHSRRLLEAVHHPATRYIGSIDDAAAFLLTHVAPDDIVITLSAGDGNRVGQLVLTGLRAREAAA